MSDPQQESIDPDGTETETETPEEESAEDAAFPMIPVESNQTSAL